MTASPTVVARTHLHGDRWATYAERAGVRRLAMPTLDELRGLSVFDGLPDSFLEEIGHDVALVEWEAGAVLFEEGSYLDLAFWIESGEVELFLEHHERQQEPIFATRMLRTTPPGDGQRSTRLATEDFDLAPGERVRLGAGDFFGEIGALNGWPQSVTARTTARCVLVQIRLPALRQLRRRAPHLRERLDELYRARTLRQHLVSTPLLEECSGEVIDALAQRVELVSLAPGERATVEGERADHLILVRSGFLRVTQRAGADDIVVSYLSKGATLGEVELLMEGLDRWQTTTAAVGHAELVRIARSVFLETIRRQPALEQRLWGIAVDRIKEMGFTRNDFRRSDLLEFALAKGLAQGTSVLVMDMDTCTRCDDCVRGCASTHGGIPRFVREGERYEGFLIPRSCYHCEDPVCLVGCPTGAIRRANIADVVEIDPALCIGCGACSQSCPYDAIVMHDLDETWPDDAVPKRLRGTPRSLATKCDQCHSSPAGPACVSSCPHGSASRVSSLDEFDLLLRAKQAAAGGGE